LVMGYVPDKDYIKAAISKHFTQGETDI
jgi:hypothetical protein